VAAARAAREAGQLEHKVAEEPAPYQVTSTLPVAEIEYLIEQLEKQMKTAAADLEFERAAIYRDQIAELKQKLQLIQQAEDARPEWQRIKPTL